MRILFFDTETNGLPPRDRTCLSNDAEKWPRVVQIGWHIVDYSSNDPVPCVAQVAILRPDESLEWNEGSANIHKISKQMALDQGVPGNEILAEFARDAATADVIIAHNLAFDKPVLKAEFYRMNSAETFTWWPGQEYCTMEGTKALCKLPSKFGRASDPYKWPQLGELYTFLFSNTTPLVLHSADADVKCLIDCFQALVLRDAVPLEMWRRVLRARRATV